MKKNQSPEALALQAQRKRLARPSPTRRPRKRSHSHRISPTQQSGYLKEQQAVLFLQQQGLTILEQNVQSRYGEIDIVARSTNTLVIIEVRFRKNQRYGGARSSISVAKQNRIKHTTLSLLSHWSHLHFNGATPFCRFDVIAFEAERLIWIQNAFS